MFQIIFQDNNQSLVLTTIQFILNNFKIENWSRNREPDMNRVKDIAIYYEKNNIKLIQELFIHGLKMIFIIFMMVCIDLNLQNH